MQIHKRNKYNNYSGKYIQNPYFNPPVHPHLEEPQSYNIHKNQFDNLEHQVQDLLSNQEDYEQPPPRFSKYNIDRPRPPLSSFDCYIHTQSASQEWSSQWNVPPLAYQPDLQVISQPTRTIVVLSDSSDEEEVQEHENITVEDESDQIILVPRLQIKNQTQVNLESEIPNEEKRKLDNLILQQLRIEKRGKYTNHRAKKQKLEGENPKLQLDADCIKLDGD